jgi:hypothetical protein
MSNVVDASTSGVNDTRAGAPRSKQGAEARPSHVIATEIMGVN